MLIGNVLRKGGGLRLPAKLAVRCMITIFMESLFASLSILWRRRYNILPAVFGLLGVACGLGEGSVVGSCRVVWYFGRVVWYFSECFVSFYNLADSPIYEKPSVISGLVSISPRFSPPPHPPSKPPTSPTHPSTAHSAASLQHYKESKYLWTQQT